MYNSKELHITLLQWSKSLVEVLKLALFTPLLLSSADEIMEIPTVVIPLMCSKRREGERRRREKGGGGRREEERMKERGE